MYDKKGRNHTESRIAGGVVSNLTADSFVRDLVGISRSEQVPKTSRYFAEKECSEVLGVSIGEIFPIAKRFAMMPLAELERLLDDPHYEIRMGAVAIMDFKARNRRLDEGTRQALFDLYLRKHDRINNWDLVDRAAPHVIGGWLADKSRDVLYELAASNDRWRRRTAVVATWYFIRAGETEETFKICALLVDEPDEYVRKAIGSWLRTAGKVNPEGLIRFLDRYAEQLPRISMRMATEKLPKDQRDGYLAANEARRG